jgi:putative hemolysin
VKKCGILKTVGIIFFEVKIHLGPELHLLILLLLLFLSAFFSGAEVALLSVSHVRIKSFLKENKRGARALSRLKANPQKMIITILIGNNVANFAAAALVTVIAEKMLGSAGISIGVGVLTLVILVFGEITPKSLSSAYAGRIALIVARPIEILSLILSPVIDLLVTFNKLVHKAVKLPPYAPITETDIRSAIELGLEKRLIEPQEEMIIMRALKLHDISAYEVMTLKNKMFLLDAGLKIDKAVGPMSKISYTRIPVFAGSPERIVGIIHMKDVLRAVEKGRSDQTLKEIAQEPVFIGYNTRIDDLLRLLLRNQTHMMLVINGEREVIGLVTLEDVLEEIVGEITDEKEILPGTVIRVDKNTIIAHGETEIEKINHFFNAELPVSFVTLSRLVHASLPKAEKNASFTVSGIKITVAQVYRGKFRKIRLEKSPLPSGKNFILSILVLLEFATFSCLPVP